jgi:hypothetical protein
MGNYAIVSSRAAPFAVAANDTNLISASASEAPPRVLAVAVPGDEEKTAPLVRERLSLPLLAVTGPGVISHRVELRAMDELAMTTHQNRTKPAQPFCILIRNRV